MKRAFIKSTNCVTPLGFDLESNFDALLNGVSGISKQTSDKQGEYFAGKTDSKALEIKFSELSKVGDHTYLEQMSILALQPIVEIISSDVLSSCGFIVSTTKGNIELLESAGRLDAKLSAYAKKVAAFFNIIAEPIIVSNACVSGLYALAVAKRLIVSGIYDNVLVLAADVISPFVVSGFQSFQAISDEPCKPYSENRKGVNIGEAAAAVWVSSNNENCSVEILGHGSVNDANHISGPSRSGEGLFQSVERAVAESGITKDQIGFISAHGTATTFNDEMESIAFNRCGLGKTPLNSLKGYYGHTLGASGLLETIISIESLEAGKLIVSKGFEMPGTSEPLAVITESKEFKSDYFLKTASGFGGSNTAIVFKKC